MLSGKALWSGSDLDLWVALASLAATVVLAFFAGRAHGRALRAVRAVRAARARQARDRTLEQ